MREWDGERAGGLVSERARVSTIVHSCPLAVRYSPLSAGSLPNHVRFVAVSLQAHCRAPPLEGDPASSSAAFALGFSQGSRSRRSLLLARGLADSLAGWPSGEAAGRLAGGRRLTFLWAAWCQLALSCGRAVNKMVSVFPAPGACWIKRAGSSEVSSMRVAPPGACYVGGVDRGCSDGLAIAGRSLAA